MKPSPTVSFVDAMADADDEDGADPEDDAAPAGDVDAPGPQAPATIATINANGAVLSRRDGRFTGPPIPRSADAHEPALEDDDDEIQADPQHRDRQEGGE